MRKFNKSIGGILIACFYFCPVFVCAKNKPGQVVEVKCLVPVAKMAEFSKSLSLRSRAPLTRVVSFYETESLSLFHHEPKVILRSRYDSSSETDTTVKVRGGKIRSDNVQCEFDKVLGKERILSCSVTDTKQEKSQIKKANAGTDVKKIFSKEQEAVLESAFGRLDWKELMPYGPVKGIQVWKKIKLPGGPDLTVERWRLPARQGKPARVILEVSAKAPLADEAKVSKWIAGLVGITETESGQESENKTLIVLDHFRPGHLH